MGLRTYGTSLLNEGQALFTVALCRSGLHLTPFYHLNLPRVRRLGLHYLIPRMFQLVLGLLQGNFFYACG